jgi:hypothetical protein
MPANIFRLNPPQELIEACLSSVKVHGLQDSTWFSKTCINLSQLEEYLPELEPYYLPCKAKEYIHKPLTPARGILILRQLLGTCGVKLVTQERSTSSVKGAWYQIQKTSILNEPVTMDFS